MSNRIYRPGYYGVGPYSTAGSSLVVAPPFISEPVRSPLIQPLPSVESVPNNLCPNPGFEDGNDGTWTLVHGGSIETAGNAQLGAWNGRLAHTASQYPSHSRLQAFCEGVNPGDVIVAAFNAMKLTASTGTTLILLNWYNGVTYLSTSQSGNLTSVQNAWTRHSYTAQAPANTTRVRIDLYMSNGIAGDVACDNVSVTKIVNLLKNSGFEDGPQGWTTEYGGSIEAANPNSGMFNGRLKHLTSEYAGPSRLYQTVTGLTGNWDYTAQYKAKKLTASTGLTRVRLHWYDPYDALISTSDSGNKTSVEGSWTTHTYSATAPTNTSYAIVEFWMNNDAAGDVAIDEAMLEVGSTANSYVASADVFGPLMTFALAGR